MGDSAKSGNDHLCGVDQSRSYAYADGNSSEPIGLESCSVSEGEEFDKLLSEFSSLRKRYWAQHLWARGYWAASSGNVTDEVWKDYIEKQKPNDPDDDFSVL